MCPEVVSHVVSLLTFKAAMTPVWCEGSSWGVWYLRPVTEEVWSADSTAVVEAGASIGSGTKIWHHCHVREGAIIGTDCSLGKDVYVDSGATIGNRVKIQNGVSVFSGVSIGDDVFVGPGVVFTNDLVPRAAGDWTIVPTTVASGASIGANATIVCGVTVGFAAMVGAGAVVTREVEPHQLVVGNPARGTGWVCQCGAVVSRQTAPPPTMMCEACVAASVEGP